MYKILLVLSLFAFISNGVLAANWNDPNVVLVQSIKDHKFRDAKTGQYVSTKGMPEAMKNPRSADTGAGAGAGTKPDVKAPETKTGTQTGGKWYNNKGAAGMSKTGKAMAGAGAVLGTVGVLQSASGTGEHDAGNMLSGAVSGLTAGCSIGSFFPVYGTAIGCAVGLVAGLVVPGSQLFSETDCLHDPITGKYTCCNTVFNKGDRQVGIGGYMFCGVEQNGQMVIKPGVRQCLQGGSEKPASWWDGLWLDDAWSPECKNRWCNDEPPADTDVEIFADTDKFCYNWKLKDPSEDNFVPDPYQLTIQKIQTQINEILNQCGNLL